MTDSPVDAGAGAPAPAPVPGTGAPVSPPRPFWKRLWARRWVRVGVILLAVATPVFAAGGMAGWRYIKTDPDFCVSCHLMETPGEKWRHSAHKDVACQTCHRADIFEEARLGYAAFIERKTEIPPHTSMPISICKECHTSNDPQWKQIGATPGHKSHAFTREISCLACHVQSLHQFKADLTTCKRCHGPDKLHMSKMDELHCVGCHDFLGKRKDFLGNEVKDTLIPAASDCRSCHGVDPAQSKAKAAPTVKGHEDCLGCHRPHGKPLDDPIDCLSCHRKILQPDSAHYKDERLGEKCRECHEPHVVEAPKVEGPK